MLAALTSLAIGPAACGDGDGQSSNRNPLLQDEDAGPAGRPPTPVTGMTTYDRAAAVPGFAVEISLSNEDVVLEWAGNSYYGEEIVYDDATIYRSTDPVALRDLVLGAPLPAGVTATAVSGVGSWVDVGAASRTVQTPHYYYRVALGGDEGNGGGASGQAAYLRADQYPPWGQNTNELAMDLAFGAGTWDDLRFETVNTGSLFSSQYSFIFLEGGDSNASELEAFVADNMVAIEQWVDAGGTLFLNSAPNEGGSQAWGFGGVTLNYYDFPTDPGHAIDPSHPIWNGPFLPVATEFTGSYYAHASISGPGLTGHILDADGGNPNLAELDWGLGHVMFGGLTTSNFWYPTDEALNLRANIIDYLVNGATSGPQLSTMVMKTTTVTAPGYNRFGLCMLDGPATASEAYAELGGAVVGIHQWDADVQDYVSWTPGAPDFPLLYGSAMVAQLDGSAESYLSIVGVVPTSEALAVSGEPGYNWATLPVFYDGPTSSDYWISQAGYWGVGVRFNDTQSEQWDWVDPGYDPFEMEPCGGYNFYLPNNACASNEDCGDGTFCYFVEPAACGDVAAGICMAQPLGCEGASENPVCGCDGQTYANECLAQAAGVATRDQGECPYVPVEPTCGDGNLDAGEQCDGGNLGDNSCGTLGFGGGELGCTADCTFDTSACAPLGGGGGGDACEGGQDPLALALGACQTTYEFCDIVSGGVVGHNGVGTGSNCGNADYEWRFYCTESSDGGNYNCSACTVGEVLGAHDPCNCDPGTSPVLGSFCDAVPVEPMCGDGNLDAGEQCDGADLGGNSCGTLGAGYGQLGCTAECTLDTSACVPFGGGGGDGNADVCEAGQDPVTGAPWVVCAVDGDSAWVSHSNPGGGSYHAEQICASLGYGGVGSFGGTCGNVCGYCEGATSCDAPGNQNFDGAGNCGIDEAGQIFCNTVMWECVSPIEGGA